MGGALVIGIQLMLFYLYFIRQYNHPLPKTQGADLLTQATESNRR